MECQAKFRNLELEIETDIEKHEYTLCSDERRLKQVLMNLVSNGLKFTLEGGVKIKV